MHDIIDNRHTKLVDRINSSLVGAEAAHFAIGYFFLSGFEAISDKLSNVHKIRLLIGNTSNQKTIEQIAEGYRQLAALDRHLEQQAEISTHRLAKGAILSTTNQIRSQIELMAQTDSAQKLIHSLVGMIKDRRLEVKVYTKNTLHAKAYIFDYNSLLMGKSGGAIVGSSNLSLAGLSLNSELNVIIDGDENHQQLTSWFDELWEEADNFDGILIKEMQESWAMDLARPYDVYMKTLYQLVGDRVENSSTRDLVVDNDISQQLADFQKSAVTHAVQNIRDYRGTFICDVVGLGKSYIGAAVVKHLIQTERVRPLIICPPPLREMWEYYNEKYELNARILSMSMLKELDGFKYRDRDFVLIDESHHLRHSGTQRYKYLQEFLAVEDKRCCLITATPRNKSAWDIFHQLKLFQPDDKTELPIDPPDLREFFQQVDRGEKDLSELLSHVLIRRTRNHILRYYGYDSQSQQKVDPSNFSAYLKGEKKAYILVGGQPRFFPRRELKTIEYSIEDTYQGLYDELRSYLGSPGMISISNKAPVGELTYARYSLWNYVNAEYQEREPYTNLHGIGSNLCGLMRILLFKRFESSVYAFRQTINKLILNHEHFINALDLGFVPAGKEAQIILNKVWDGDDDTDFIDLLAEATGKYDINHFDAKKLRRHVAHDLNIFQQIQKLVDPISPSLDAKLIRLQEYLNSRLNTDKKHLIFTQYTDTANYIYRHLNPQDLRADIAMISGANNSKNKINLVNRFAPKANHDYQFKYGEVELKILIATDVLGEGLNLQDGDSIINYDLHWNPVKLIQRFGRIDRIGSDKSVICGANFLPELGIERNLGLKEKLTNRIREIHTTIGEDAAILDRSEQVNETAMYAIYEARSEELDVLEGADINDAISLNEAEEILRQLRKEDPTEFQRIAHLPNGIRTAKFSDQQVGTFIFCQATNPLQPDKKGYQQLFLVDRDGNIVSRDIPKILATIVANQETLTTLLPDNYNQVVTKILTQFTAEVQKRQQQKEQRHHLTVGQRYIIRELAAYSKKTNSLDIVDQIEILDRAVRHSTNSTVLSELNEIKRQGKVKKTLFNRLIKLFDKYGLPKQVEETESGKMGQLVTTIVCSAALEN
jgi:superfamily II DNA/RNA helicase